MEWTTIAPTIEGWYWFRGSREDYAPTGAEIFFVHSFEDRGFGVSPEVSDADVSMPLSDYHGEWAGPIPEPVDAPNFP